MSTNNTKLATPRTCVISNGRKCITSCFTDGSELVEEFDVITDSLLLRKRRTKNKLGAFGDWEVEVGADIRSRNIDRALLVEANGSPELVRQDTNDRHVIRIRYLPYPRDNFVVKVERSAGDTVGEIVVRTVNKKYFKRIALPEMARLRIPLDESQLSYDVKNNTLIIEYKKHIAVLAADAAAKKERAALPAKRVDESAQGCPAQ